MNLLFIDSDDSFAGPLKRSLERGGIAVDLYGDGKSGFEAARGSPPNAIVLSVELGDQPTSGYTWCQKLKKDEATREVPLVLVSSQATRETFEQHKKLRNRADEYLPKPFDAATLLHALGRHVVLPAGAIDVCSSTLHGVAVPTVEELLDSDDDFLNFDEAFDLLTAPDAGGPAGPVAGAHIEVAFSDETATGTPRDGGDFGGPGPVELGSELATNRGELDAMLADRAALQAALDAAREGLDVAGAEAETYRTEPAAARAEADGMRARIVEVEAELAVWRERATVSAAETDRLTGGLSRVRDEATADSDRLRARVTGLEDRLARSEEELRAARAELEARSAAAARARALLAEAVAALA